MLVVGPNYPDTTLAGKLADAIMLFYDEDEADWMFDTADCRTFVAVLTSTSKRKAGKVLKFNPCK